MPPDTVAAVAAPVARERRVSTPRRFLMCPPTYFDVVYSINPWMRPDRPTDRGRAVAQWERLHSLLVGLGHDVQLIEPGRDLPDMVFAANGALVVDGKALVARFRHRQRSGETPAWAGWLREHGYRTRVADRVNEGEGDCLVAGDLILAGAGYRTDPDAHTEMAEFFGRPVVGLTLVDPRFYHLDTALAVLDAGTVMYFPGAFSPASRATLARLYPEAILATEEEAAVFGLNAVSDGRYVVLAREATRLAAELADRGFVPIGVDLTELLKAGGGAKCCSLELRPAR